MEKVDIYFLILTQLEVYKRKRDGEISRWERENEKIKAALEEEGKGRRETEIGEAEFQEFLSPLRNFFSRWLGTTETWQRFCTTLKAVCHNTAFFTSSRRLALEREYDLFLVQLEQKMSTLSLANNKPAPAGQESKNSIETFKQLALEQVALVITQDALLLGSFFNHKALWRHLAPLAASSPASLTEQQLARKNSQFLLLWLTECVVRRALSPHIVPLRNPVLLLVRPSLHQRLLNLETNQVEPLAQLYLLHILDFIDLFFKL
jgi:hypothetical protein